MFSSVFDGVARVPRGLVYALIAAPFALSLGYVWAFGVNVPFGDQFAIARLLFAQSSGGLSWDLMLAPHNEHRIPVPKAAMLLLGSLTAYNTVAEMYVIQGCLLATMAVLFLAFRENAKAPLFLFIPVSLLVFSFRQYENLLWGFQITFAFAQTFGILSLYLLHTSLTGKRPTPTLAAAVASGMAASFSASPGLLVWPAGLAMVAICRGERSAKARAGAVWGAAWVLTWTLYFIGYAPNRQAPPFLGQLSENPVAVAMHFPTFLGSGLFWHLPLAVAGGVAFLALSVYVVFVSHRRGELGGNAFWIGALLFSFGIAAIVLYGRASFGLQNATASRYAPFSMLALASVYVILLKLALQTRTRFLTTLAAAFCVVLVVNLAASYYAGLVLGQESKEMRERGAAALYDYESTPASAFPNYLNQPPEGARQTASQLESLDYSVFAEEPREE